jgi:hypothetical protein
MTQLACSMTIDSATPFPFFTDADPSLSRSSGGRDPLGLLPIWSAFGRKLVPHFASPVFQLHGLKAVLLILWAIQQETLQTLVTRAEDQRRLFRLMEGMIEYWLYRETKNPCYGRNMLSAQEANFHFTTRTAKTAVNGLYQYYRGTVRRAGLVDHEWRVIPQVSDELKKLWPEKTFRQLEEILKAPMANPAKALVPELHLDKSGALAIALEEVFGRNALRAVLQDRLFGSDEHKQLAENFLELKRVGAVTHLRFDELVAQLVLPSLIQHIGSVRRCEPFLLLMQDVFDLLRVSAGQKVAEVGQELASLFDQLRKRARDFIELGTVLESPRMTQILRLAAIIGNTSDQAGEASQQHTVMEFIRELAKYHRQCMKERARDPLILIESDMVVLPAAGDRDRGDVLKRLANGYPWMNDYYLNTACGIYAQAFGSAA